MPLSSPNTGLTIMEPSTVPGLRCMSMTASKSAIPFIEKSHAKGKPFFHKPLDSRTAHAFSIDPKLQKRFVKLGEKDAIYAATLYHADLRIGQLLDALDRLDLTKDTLVLFSSDNGPARGAPDAPLTLGYDSATGLGYGIAAAKGITGGRRAYKGALLEGGIGVPFIVRWPGKVPAGKVDKASILSAVDLLPTFCELAGSPIAPFLQARWNQPSRCTQGKREFETDQATLLENGSGLAPPRSQARSLGVLCRGEHAMEISGQ